ncbi:hypothetical protein QNH36_12310 [Mesobacillus sp. AQ2]|jgi:hypothetical protein|uniref:hypothetical protein n=1 Tax=Bacillaceae TaxID=186817 RepID=UPI00164334A0|nr:MULTISPECIES: hypothetical protein [Bacillaceae]MCM3121549.1 hypothetical protein [Mesobacillus sp. MER 33]MCM3231513.1 hypothetical protein [Mesobacillus sp. MER 48]WHX38494.1 hypothetical protein QNH36_12310 [Mesobacillus sp. AQ2]
MVNMKKDWEDPDDENGIARLFGLDKETSLQSVNFATSESLLLNEHFQEDSQK